LRFITRRVVCRLSCLGQWYAADDVSFKRREHLAGKTADLLEEHFTLGSLQRRLRNCLIGMRAEIYPYIAPEYAALETFLMWRARGMPMETPGVRP
jgi:hypothetical protein